MSRKIINEINVTPFIDIMLVLLAIFMVTSPMTIPGIQVELPQTTAAPITGDNKAIVLTVSSKGNVYLQDQAVSLNNLEKQIIQLSNNDKSVRIFVRGDRESNYGQVVRTISVIQNAGFTKVALITDHENT